MQAATDRAVVVQIRAQDRVLWLDIVNLWPRLSDFERRLAALVSMHFNSTASEGYAGQERLATLADGVTPRHVRRGLNTLRAEGLLIILKIGRTNYYKPSVNGLAVNAFGGVDLGRVKAELIATKLARTPDTGGPLSGADRGHGRSAIPAGNRGHFEAPIADMGGPPNTCIEHTDMRAPTREGGWAAAMEFLRQRIGAAQERAWFAEIQFVGCDEGLLSLSAPSRFVRDQVIKRYREAIIACWQKQNLHSSKAVHVAIAVRSTHPTSAKRRSDQ